MDATTLLAAVILVTPPTVLSLLALRKTQKLRVEVNHRLSELIEAKGKAGEAKGREDARRERAEEDE